MAVQLNPNLIMQAVGPTVPLNSLAKTYSDTVQLRGQQATVDAVEEAARQKSVLNDAYKVATLPDGTIDQTALQGHLAANLGGAQIPGIRKANLDLQKTQGEVNDKTASTAKTVQETVYNGLKQVDSSIASLAARPDVDEKMVYGEMGRLVSAGAFDGQAAHSKTTPDAYARDLLSTMPVGNPQALHSWLIQAGSRVSDAADRLKLMLPQYNAQDRGGSINEGTVNQMTGQRTAGPDIPKTASPEAVLSAQTQRRGQDLTNDRASTSLNLGVKGLSPEESTALSTAINEGRLDPNRINSRTASLLAGLAIQNPHTDFNKLGADSALMKNAQFQQKAMIANTLPEIMDNMVEAGKKVGFSSNRTVGKMQGWVKGEFNDPDMTEYMTQRNDALMNIAGVMRSVGMTDMAHKAETEVAAPTMAPAALDGWLRGQYKSLQPRLQNYNRVMHTPMPHGMVAASPPAALPGGMSPPVGAGVAPPSGAVAPGRPAIDSFFIH